MGKDNENYNTGNQGYNKSNNNKLPEWLTYHVKSIKLNKIADISQISDSEISVRS
jgi:hypothetical protein